MNQNPRNFENNESKHQFYILCMKKTIKNRSLNIIGTQFFKRPFINKKEKYWRSFNSKILKKDIIVHQDRLPKWVNSIKIEFIQLNFNQINQIKDSALQKLLDLLSSSSIIHNFESNLNFGDENE